MTRSPTNRLVQVALLFGAAVSFARCGDTGPMPVDPAGISSARASRTTPPVVSAANPASGLQGDLGDQITITGSGFSAGDQASWERHGVTDPKIQVVSTAFISSTQLVATINIASDADTALYDVAVLSASRGKGIGTELFAVKATGNTDTHARANLVFADQVNVGTATSPSIVPARIRGDGRLKNGLPASGTPSNEYQGDWCGVDARLWGLSNESGDMVFYPQNLYSKFTACGAARFVNFYFDGVTPSPVNTASNAADLVDPAVFPNVGDTRLQNMGFGVPNCTRLRFTTANVTGTPTSQVRVTRLADVAPGVRQWRAESQGTHTAECLNTVKRKEVVSGTWYMPFSLTITEVPFPYPTYP